MKGRTGAAVINVASISGWSPQLAMSGQYGAAKAALIFDTERWALEFVPHRVRVNTVSPGSILVEGNGWDRYRLANPAHFEDYVRHGFPMDRLGIAQEVPADGLEQPHAALDRRRYQGWARASSRPARTRRQMNASSKPLL
jgi:NAD(P)-dependent dehydrogenase (short-subunit alcohol dehydrogenase family)